MTETREPPHSLESERAVLGGVLVKPAAFHDVAAMLDTQDFVLPAHREILEAMAEVVRRGMPVDVIALGDELKSRGTIGRLEGGPQYLIKLADSVPTAENISHYVRIVKEHAASRKLIELCTHAASAAYGEEDWAEKLARLRSGLAELENLGVKSGTVHVAEAIREATDEIERIQKGEQVPRVWFGIEALDNVVDGCEPGDLVIVAARPGVGKSAFVGNVAAYCGMHEVPTWFGAIEMTKHKVGRRWLAGDTRIDSNKFKRGNVDLDDWRKITASADRFAKSLLWINDSVTKLSAVVAEIRRWHGMVVVPRFAKTGKLVDKRAMAVVDYAQRIQSSRQKGDTREAEVAKIPVALKNLGKSTGIVVVLVVMVSRAAEARGGDPCMADLRESGAFEQEADIIVFLANNGDKGPRAIVAKNREGGGGEVPLNYSGETTTWSSQAQDSSAPDTRGGNWQDGRDG